MCVCVCVCVCVFVFRVEKKKERERESARAEWPGRMPLEKHLKTVCNRNKLELAWPKSDIGWDLVRCSCIFCCCSLKAKEKRGEGGGCSQSSRLSATSLPAVWKGEVNSSGRARECAMLSATKHSSRCNWPCFTWAGAGGLNGKQLSIAR